LFSASYSSGPVCFKTVVNPHPVWSSGTILSPILGYLCFVCLSSNFSMFDQATHAQEPADVQNQPIPPNSISEKDNTIQESIAQRAESSDEYVDNVQPHLHARTFLAVFAVCLIYFAQDFALVGAGAVSGIIS
jgi:hypothetical protein